MLGGASWDWQSVAAGSSRPQVVLSSKWLSVRHRPWQRSCQGGVRLEASGANEQALRVIVLALVRASREVELC